MGCITTNGSAIQVEISADGSLDSHDNVLHNWVDVSAQFMMIDPTGGDIATTQTNTFCGAVITEGRPALKQLTATITKTQTLFDFFDTGAGTTLWKLLTELYDDRECFWLRYTYTSNFTPDGCPDPIAGDERCNFRLKQNTWPKTGADANGTGLISKQFVFPVVSDVNDLVPVTP